MEWIFFDIGGTLADETKSLHRRAELTAKMQNKIGIHCTTEQIEEAMKKAASMGLPYFQGAVDLLGLRGMVPYDAVGEKLYGDVKPVLEALHGKYHLGIIANQPLGTEGRLRQYGIRDYFEVVLSSAEEGLHKPDPALFARALARAGCAPGEAWMIGDRPDNDIAPAKSLGMKTVRVRQGLGGTMPVSGEAQKADDTVDSLSELLKIFL
ncbi:MAG: HAD family hydrolase [Clostridia bacterium]|nr:HAD family hydrolase [Clostridia bacterium]